MPFNTLSGFQVGQNVAGPSAFGSFISQLTDRANQMMGLRLQAQAGGLAEEEKMKGMARFYQSPEGQGYIENLGKQTQTMIGGAPSAVQPQGNVSTSSGVGNADQQQVGAYNPEYMWQPTIDPFNPSATKLMRVETPQSKIRGAIAEEQGKQISDRNRKMGIAQDQIDSLKNVIERDVPAIGSQFLSNARGTVYSRIGNVSSGSADYNRAIANAKVSVPLFIQSVGNISSGRLTAQELNTMGQLLLQIPSLDATGREKNYHDIDMYLKKGGIDSGFSRNTPSTPFQSNQSSGKIHVRNKQTGQTGILSQQYFDPSKYEQTQ